MNITITPVSMSPEITVDETTYTIEVNPNAVIVDGVGVQTATIDTNGHLIITKTNGDIQDAGYVVGPAGQDGQTGSLWYSGIGSPSPAIGIDLDIYLDTANGDLYQKLANVWNLKTNIIGL